MRKWLALLFLLCAVNAHAGIDFDNTDDYVDCGAATWLASNLTELSISVWVYHDTITTDDYVIAQQGNTAGGVLLLRDDVDSVSGRLDGYTFFVQGDLGGPEQVRGNSAENSSVANTWTHLCGTVLVGDSAGLDLLINGVTGGGGFPLSTTSMNELGASGNNLTIGANNGAAPFMDGKISDLTIWSKQLTDAECKSIYDSKVKGFSLQIQPASILAYYPMDDQPDGTSFDGDTVYDRSGNARNCTGNDGANNTGLTAKAEEILSYP